MLCSRQVEEVGNTKSSIHCINRIRIQHRWTEERIRFIVKVFLMCIIQIFLTIFLQALVQSIEAVREFFSHDSWINYVFSSVSLALTLALIMIRNLRYLQPYNYLILMMITLNMSGVIICMSVAVKQMWVFVSWMAAIIISIFTFLIGVKLRPDITKIYKLLLIYISIVTSVAGIEFLILHILKHRQAAANIIGISTQFVVFALRLFGSQMLQGSRHFTFEIQEYTGNFVSLDVNMLLVCWISHEFCDYSYLIVIGNGVE
ncbi:unnamed protein product [Heterobilharzia americana]|nr:unnamed protein product [Heterobilharzia americana]